MPSGENATELTPPECPSKVRISCPLAASHSLSVLSELPESRRVPSGENATEVTASECPSKVRISRPLAASHSLSVLSSLPDSTRVPSGENATEVTSRVRDIGHDFDLGPILRARLQHTREDHHDCRGRDQTIPAPMQEPHNRTSPKFS